MAVTATALAGTGEQIHLTAAGKAAARVAVVTKRDLGAKAMWTGGTIKPEITPVDCTDFHPKVSDLVINGMAETGFAAKSSPPLQIYSLSEVLATPKMVRLDWQRTAGSPGEIACLGTLVASHFSRSRFLAIHRLDLPHIGTHTAAWRAELLQTTGPQLHFIYDLVEITHGRTEISLTITAPISYATAISARESRIGAALYARARA